MCGNLNSSNSQKSLPDGTAMFPWPQTFDRRQETAKTNRVLTKSTSSSSQPLTNPQCQLCPASKRLEEFQKFENTSPKLVHNVDEANQILG